MQTIIKTIRFSSIMSILSALATYLVCLNMETGFIRIDSIWISNNFVLTVEGGIFTGFFVMLLCEIQKYLLSKRETEDFLFSHTGYMYGQLLIMKTHLQKCLTDTSEIVPQGLLNMPVTYLKNEISMVINTEYCLIRKNADFLSLQETFHKFLSGDLMGFLNSIAYLDIAVNTDQINNLKTKGIDFPITANSPTTGLVLRILDSKIDPLMNNVDRYLLQLDDYCHKRYQWETRKSLILRDWSATSYHGFEEFLKQEEYTGGNMEGIDG